MSTHAHGCLHLNRFPVKCRTLTEHLRNKKTSESPRRLFSQFAHASNHTSVRKVSGVLAVVVIAVAIVVYAFIPFERPQDVIEDKATDLRALADPVLHGGAKVNAAKDSRISVLQSSL